MQPIAIISCRRTLGKPPPFCVSPALPLRSSAAASPSVPQLRSFHHFYLSLVCCAFSPHRFTTSLLPCLLHHPPIPLCAVPSPPPLISFKKAFLIHPPPHLSLTVIFSSLPSPPALLHVTMHHSISYQIVTFCFLLGIHNLLRIFPRLCLVLSKLHFIPSI